MGIIAKNLVVGEHVKETAPPPPPKHVNVFEKLRQQAQPVVETVKVEDAPDKYHHIKEGELHKMINTKSDYLSDMLALEKGNL